MIQIINQLSLDKNGIYKGSVLAVIRIKDYGLKERLHMVEGLSCFAYSYTIICLLNDHHDALFFSRIISIKAVDSGLKLCHRKLLTIHVVAVEHDARYGEFLGKDPPDVHLPHRDGLAAPVRVEDGAVHLVLPHRPPDQLYPLVERNAGDERIGDEGFVGYTLDRPVRVHPHRPSGGICLRNHHGIPLLEVVEEPHVVPERYIVPEEPDALIGDHPLASGDLPFHLP